MKVTPIVALHLNLFGLNILMRVILTALVTKTQIYYMQKLLKGELVKKLCWVDISSLSEWGIFVHRC